MPKDCDSGQVVYLISGLVGFSDIDIRTFLLNCVVGGINLRIIQVVDSDASRLSGICLDDSTGAFFDRSHWPEHHFNDVYKK